MSLPLWMRALGLAGGIALGLTASVAGAQTQPAGKVAPASAPVAAAKAKYGTITTPLRTLLADPAAKAVLAKHAPDLFKRSPDELEFYSDLTLKELQQSLRGFSPDLLTDKVLAGIDQDLASLPTQK